MKEFWLSYFGIIAGAITYTSYETFIHYPIRNWLYDRKNKSKTGSQVEEKE